MRIRFTARGAPGLRRMAVLAVTALALLAAASARASTAALERYSEPPGTPPEESCAWDATCPRWRLVVRAALGEANDVDLLPAGDAILVRDVAIRPGNSCLATLQGDVRCPRPDSGIEVLLGDGPDRVQAPAVTGVYRGGPGDDLISAAGTLIGDDGADTLSASTASTRLAGGSGDDRLVGPATRPHCGGGRDVFEPRRTAVLTTPHHLCEGIAAREEGFELAITPLQLHHGRVLLRLRGTRSTPVTVRVTVRAAASRRRLASARFPVGPNGVVHALSVGRVSDRRVLVIARAGGHAVGFAGVLGRGREADPNHVVTRAVIRSHVSKPVRPDVEHVCRRPCVAHYCGRTTRALRPPHACAEQWAVRVLCGLGPAVPAGGGSTEWPFRRSAAAAAPNRAADRLGVGSRRDH